MNRCQYVSVFMCANSCLSEEVRPAAGKPRALDLLSKFWIERFVFTCTDGVVSFTNVEQAFAK